MCMTSSIGDLDIRVPEAAIGTEIVDDGMDEMENTADLITEGDTVAVVPADENDDYSLLKIFPYSHE
ncbi:hypothetical protein DPMN_158467 [Dreissena polymorpha]|uniref:Uncharacterized protein n=1 Tax=Dreissena polymorpha TaxID=45954 RepID=A0A9D4EIQ6_DREPO|nr:hypothetical protein DPMN_158236 [Dreissena polymorpha]KAH3780439.1 hypothetical protein DPMN_158254 [Dreissena polymorpha]KAH3780648.1 hypothetical protein DPMN_158467 [Dreissena polymorpha]